MTLHVEPGPLKQRRRALEAALRDAIRSGRLAARARLPSSRALADDLGLARTTVSEAYAQLEAEGYLVARRGAGTWVTELGQVPSPPREAATSGASALRFSFNPGVPDLFAFPHTAWAKCLLEGLRELPASALGYGDPRGLPELRAVLADYLARARGVVADPELLVVCAGFSHALSLLSRVLQSRGLRSIAMEDPCLSWHREIVTGEGLEVVSLEVDAQGALTPILGESDANAVLLCARPSVSARIGPLRAAPRSRDRVGTRVRRHRDRGRLRRRAPLRPHPRRRAAGARPRARRLQRHGEQEPRARPQARLDGRPGVTR